MRYLKAFGLAVIAASGLLSFGASAASATTLFTDSAKTIAYPAGTTIHMTLKTGTSLKFTDTAGNLIGTCTGGTIHLTTSSKSSSVVAGAIGSLTWEGCSQTTDTVANGSLDFTFTSGTNGSVTGTASQVTLGIFGVSCTYGTGEGTTLGAMTGGAEPELNTEAVVAKTAGGFLCPAWVRVEGRFVVTSPHALFFGA